MMDVLCMSLSQLAYIRVTSISVVILDKGKLYTYSRSHLNSNICSMHSKILYSLISYNYIIQRYNCMPSSLLSRFFS